MPSNNERCSKCNNPFESHHWVHTNRGKSYHTSCYDGKPCYVNDSVSQQKEEKCFCQSFYDDNLVLQDCTCGKCSTPHPIGEDLTTNQGEISSKLVDPEAWKEIINLHGEADYEDIEQFIDKKALSTLLSSRFQEGHTEGFNLGLAKEFPMGVSQWLAHGEKYGYDTYFEQKGSEQERERIKADMLEKMKDWHGAGIAMVEDYFKLTTNN